MIKTKPDAAISTSSTVFAPRGDLIPKEHSVDPVVGFRGIRLRVFFHRAVDRLSSARAVSKSTLGLRRANSSVMRCTRPVTIVADR